MEILAAISAVRAQYKPVNLFDHDIMLRNLGIILQMIVASEELMRVALQRLNGSRDVYDQRLADYFAEHLAEETGHYSWLLDDLGDQKVSFEWIAAELAGTQYYLVNHMHPSMLLGYMAVLECFPAPLEMVDKLEEIHGKCLLRTLRYHAVHDQDHGKDVLHMIEEAPKHLQDWIIANAVKTAHKIGIAQEQIGENYGE